MSEITLKVTDETINEFLPIAEKLQAEGRTEIEIKKHFQSFIQAKNNRYFKKPDFSTARESLHKTLNGFQNADSTTEKVFYDLLYRNKINFKFQYPIGDYRVDFLLEDFLVVELDGVLHDKQHDQIRDLYMTGMGYVIFRVPVYILRIDPLAVIEEIRAILANKKTKKKRKAA